MATTSSEIRGPFITTYQPNMETAGYTKALVRFNFALQEEQQSLYLLLPHLHHPLTRSSFQQRVHFIQQHPHSSSPDLTTLPRITTPSHRLTDAHLVFFKTDPYATDTAITFTIRPLICIFPGNPPLVTFDKVTSYFCSEAFGCRATVSTWPSNHPLAVKKQSQDFEMNATTGFDMPKDFFVVHPYDLDLSLNRRGDLYLADFSNGNRQQFHRLQELPLLEQDTEGPLC